jgi:hypothetical protein
VLLFVSSERQVAVADAGCDVTAVVKWNVFDDENTNGMIGRAVQIMARAKINILQDALNGGDCDAIQKALEDAEASPLTADRDLLDVARKIIEEIRVETLEEAIRGGDTSIIQEALTKAAKLTPAHNLLEKGRQKLNEIKVEASIHRLQKAIQGDNRDVMQRSLDKVVEFMPDHDLLIEARKKIEEISVRFLEDASKTYSIVELNKAVGEAERYKGMAQNEHSIAATKELRSWCSVALQSHIADASSGELPPLKELCTLSKKWLDRDNQTLRKALEVCAIRSLESAQNINDLDAALQFATNEYNDLRAAPQLVQAALVKQNHMAADAIRLVMSSQIPSSKSFVTALKRAGEMAMVDDEAVTNARAAGQTHIIDLLRRAKALKNVEKNVETAEVNAVIKKMVASEALLPLLASIDDDNLQENLTVAMSQLRLHMLATRLHESRLSARRDGEGGALAEAIENAVGTLKDDDSELIAGVEELLQLAVSSEAEELFRVRAIKIALTIKHASNSSGALFKAIGMQKDIVMARLNAALSMDERQRCLEALHEIGMKDDDDLQIHSEMMEKRRARVEEHIAEQDRVVQHSNLSLGDEKDGALLFNVWDFAGQRIFQTVVNMFLIRYGVVNLVVNLELLCDLPDKNELLCDLPAHVKGALVHLEHWLSTLLTFVPGVPVIIIGTHAGKKNARDAPKQKAMSDYLEARFGQLLSQLNVTTNKEEKLLFFPVENSDPDDANIPRLRDLIEKTAVEDIVPDLMGRPEKPEASYVNFETPLSWIRVAEEIRKLALMGVSCLRLYPEDGVAEAWATPGMDSFENDDVEPPAEISFHGICDHCEAIADCTNNESVKERIRVILALFHQFGVVWYMPVEEVGTNKFLQDFAILKPQWVLEHITYIVRCVDLPFA